MSTRARLLRAPQNLPRPAAPVAPRPRPRLISLPSALLEELPPKPPSVPPPLPRAREQEQHASERVTIPRGLGGEEVIEALFDAFRDLAFEQDALGAARYCLDALHAVIPCRAAIAHVYDVTRRDFLVVQARGEAAEAIVLGRHAVDDPFLSVAMPTGQPCVWNDLRGTWPASLARFADLATVGNILVCPVVCGPRWLGAIELVDPQRGAGFREEDVLGAAYAASRYAEFLATHGVVVDVATVARFAFAS